VKGGESKMGSVVRHVGSTASLLQGLVQEQDHLVRQQPAGVHQAAGVAGCLGAGAGAGASAGWPANPSTIA
jgi:hypothetical protein